MIQLANSNVAQYLKSVSLYDNGTLTDVKRVFTYDAGDIEVIYPDPARHLRIQSNYDGKSTKVEKDGLPYGLPIVNIVGDQYTEDGFTISVDVHPKTSEWFLSSSTQAVDSSVRVGSQTLTVDLTATSDGKYQINSISAIPLYGSLQPQELRFWTICPSDSGVEGHYTFDFSDGNLVDSTSGIELTSVNGETPQFILNDDTGPALKIGYDPDLNGQHQFAYDYINGDGVSDLDYSNGYTIECAFQSRGSEGDAYIGFFDLEDANISKDQNIALWLQWGQPKFLGIGEGDGPTPYTTTAERQYDTYGTKFSHMALTIERVSDDDLRSLVEDNQVSGDFKCVHANQWTWNWVYTSPYTGVSSSFNAKSIIEGTDTTSQVYIIKSYVNGVLFGDTMKCVTASMRETYKVGNGKFRVIANNNSGLASYPLIIDGLHTYKSCLSPTSIALNAAKWTGSSSSGSDSSDDSDSIPEKRDSAPRMRVSKTVLDSQLTASFIKTFIVDDQTIAVGMNFSDFFTTQLNEQYPSLSAQLHNYAYGHCQAYQYTMPLTYDLLDLYRDYQPRIRELVDSQTKYSMSGNTLSVIGGWTNTSGLVRQFFEPNKTLVESSVADINHFAYLHLRTPMVDGNSYTVSWNGQSKTFTYSKDQYCSSLKVNQVGYQPNAMKKYAYAGAWLGTAGTHDLDLDGKPFSVYDGSTVVFTGTCTKILASDVVNVNGTVSKETGEVTYLLDFSPLSTVGSYQINVPGVGWSHKFKISNDAMGEAFYLHSRCAFHQRSGCAKLKPFTNWEYDKPDHMWTYESDFIADDQQYSDECVDLAGTNYSSVFGSKHFSMIPNNMTGKIWRDVNGGWYDAADFDNRPYHWDACNMMLIAYLLAPQNFTDNQLNIPESGDSIPDYLNEIEWCMKVWKADQREDGGISGWRETDAHESDWPWRSSMKYATAHPNRKFSLYYAEMAAKLVRCLRVAGTPAALKLATEYATSATRAFNFGVDESKTATFTFTQKSGGSDHVFTYTENCDDASFKITLLRSALAMYKMTGNRKYLEHATEDRFNAMIDKVTAQEQHYDRHLSYELLFDLKDELNDWSTRLSEVVIQKADQWVGYQDEHVYKNLNWPKNHGFYNYQTWGVGHLETRGFTIMLAWKLTGDEKYRTCLQLAFDNSMGCNPLGRTQTSGLGKVYPVHFLHHWLNRAEFEKGVFEDVPGITPYWCGWNTTGTVTPYCFCLYQAGRPDNNFDELTMNILPRFSGVPTANARGTVASWLQTNWPMQREHVEIAAQSPTISEFTISESCLGKSAIAGVLMGEGYTPSTELKSRTPCSTSKFDVEGFMYLP